MSLNLGELYTTIDARNSGFKRGLADSRKDMSGFQTDTNSRLGDIRARFAKDGEASGRGWGRGLRESATPEIDAFTRDTQGRLHDARGKYVAEGEAGGHGWGLGFLRGTRSPLSMLGKLLAGGTVISGIAAGAGAAASAIGPLIGLVGVLAVAVGTLAAATPAFALGAVAAIATLTIGFSNMSDAIAGDEEALEKLAPAAREVVGVLDGLKSEWQAVTKSVQERLFKGLADDISKVASVWLPLLQSGLGKIAGGFNAVAVAAAGALTQTSVIEGFNAVTDSTAKGLRNFSAGVAPWLAGIGVLLGAFAPLLEQAGSAAARLGQRFAEWITYKESTGQIADFIEQMKTTFGQLGAIAANVGSILFNVFAATQESGGGLLGLIEDLTGRFADFLASDEGWDALTSFFSSLRDVGDAVLPIVIELAEVFATDLAPIIGEIATAVGPSLRDLVESLGDAIGKIDVKALAEGFVDVLDAVIPLLGPIGDFIGWASGLEDIVPVVIAGLAAWAVAQWILNVAMMANPIGLIIGLVIALIAIIWLIVANWDQIAAVMALTWELIKAKAAEVWGAISDFFVGIWNSMKDYARTKVNEMLLVFGWFGDLPGRIGAWFQGVYDSARDKLDDLLDWLGGLGGKVMDALGDLGSLLYNAGRDILQGLIDGIESMWDSVQSKLADLTGSLPGWKGPEAVDKSILRPSGQWIISGLVDGFDDEIPSAMSRLQGLTTDIGMQVSSDVNGNQGEATVHLSQEDRDLLREAAAAWTRIDVNTDQYSRVRQTRENAMVA